MTFPGLQPGVWWMKLAALPPWTDSGCSGYPDRICIIAPGGVSRDSGAGNPSARGADMKRLPLMLCRVLRPQRHASQWPHRDDEGRISATPTLQPAAQHGMRSSVLVDRAAAAPYLRRGGHRAGSTFLLFQRRRCFCKPGREIQQYSFFSAAGVPFSLSPEALRLPSQFRWSCHAGDRDSRWDR
jgi:hypothetical protein